VPLQKALVGLRSWLGFFESGRLPAEWNPNVTGTVDLSFFLQQVEDFNSGTLSAITGTAGQMTCPVDEFRLVHAMGVGMVTPPIGAGQGAYWVPFYIPVSLGIAVGLQNTAPNGFTVATPATEPSFGIHFAKPFFLKPGDAIGMKAAQITAGPINFRFNCRYQTIKIS
jgi:hypothetical protein